MKTVAKAAVGHVLKQNMEDLAEGMSQIINDKQEAKNAAATVAGAATTLASHSIDATIDATVEALLKEQIEAEKNLETLKTCLKELAADKTIILFIDELDRCRPDYAVDMLEVIKHVFDVENVKVVLVTNTKQLRAAINHRYGMEVDAQKYLDKFLKYSFALPDKIVAPFGMIQALVSVEYFKQLIRKSRMADELRSLIEERNGTINFISDMIERNNISLRETERLVRFLEIYHSLSGGLNKVIWQYALLRITGVFIFCFYPSLMDDINKNRTDSKDFARLFNIQSLANIPKNNFGVVHTNTNVIAMMLILYGTANIHFDVSTLHDRRSWQERINKDFLDNENIYPYEMDGVLTILKDTFRVLSLEQTPQ